MSYQDEYKQKLTTADEAVKVVKSGDWLVNRRDDDLKGLAQRENMS